MSREKIIEVMALGIAGYKGWGHARDTVIHRDAIDAATDLLAALESAGYAIVPAEPSESMVTDGWMASVDAKCGVREAFRVGYRDMIQAAKEE